MFGATAEQMHGALVIRRLKTLVAAGYAPELKGDPSIDYIDMKHPQKGVRCVSLWADGQVVDIYPTQVSDEDGRIIIQPGDENRFRLLIKSTPKLTFQEKLAATTLGEAVQNITTWMIMIAVFWGLPWALSKAWTILRHALS